MRRSDREITDIKELREIIDECKVVRLGIMDINGMYIVPLNYGYEIKDRQLTMYFHSAHSGRKIDIMRADNKVCFEMDCNHKLVSAEIGCEYGYKYRSIIGNGIVEFVTDTEEKKTALNHIMKHQTGKEFVFNDDDTETVTIFKVISSSYTGRRNNNF